MNKIVFVHRYLALLLIILTCLIHLDLHVIAEGGINGVLGVIIASGGSIAIVGALIGRYQLLKSS